MLVAGWQAIGSGVYTCLPHIATWTHLRYSIKGLILSFNKQKCHFCVCIQQEQHCVAVGTGNAHVISGRQVASNAGGSVPRAASAAACRVCRRRPRRLHQSPAAATAACGGAVDAAAASVGKIVVYN